MFAYMYFAILSYSGNFLENKTYATLLRSKNIVKIIPTWKVEQTFSQKFSPSENNNVYSIFIFFSNQNLVSPVLDLVQAVRRISLYSLSSEFYGAQMLNKNIYIC